MIGLRVSNQVQHGKRQRAGWRVLNVVVLLNTKGGVHLHVALPVQLLPVHEPELDCRRVRHQLLEILDRVPLAGVLVKGRLDLADHPTEGAPGKAALDPSVENFLGRYQSVSKLRVFVSPPIQCRRGNPQLLHDLFVGAADTRQRARNRYQVTTILWRATTGSGWRPRDLQRLCHANKIAFRAKNFN